MKRSRDNGIARTSQACDGCCRSKLKCDGLMPQCRSCSIRNLSCTWPITAVPGESHAIVEPARSPHESVCRSAKQPRLQITNGQTVSGPHALEKPSIDLPEPRQLVRLLNIFYDRHLHTELCSFLHKPSWDIDDFHSKPPFLVTSIISLASLYLSSEEVKRHQEFETAQSMSDYYSQLASSYASGLCDEPSITTIQAYLVLSIRELISCSHVRAFMYSGTALRMSQMLKLDCAMHQNCSPRDQELRIRVFWACFVVDKVVSYSCNQPPTLSPYRVSTPLPCPENVFLLEETCDRATLESIALCKNQVSRIGVMPFFITMVELWENIASLHISKGRGHSEHGPNNMDSDFHRYSTSIEEFATNLPTSLDWSPENYKLHRAVGESQAYVNLNFLLYHSRCVMPQEYLPQLDAQYSLMSGANEATLYDAAETPLDNNDDHINSSCIPAVYMVTEMVLSLHNGSEYDRQLLQSVFAANAILTACAAFLWMLYTPTGDAGPKIEDLENFKLLRKIIKTWQPQWRVASAWVETLEMLYNLYAYSYGTNVDLDVLAQHLDASESADRNATLGSDADSISAISALTNESGHPERSAVYQRLQDQIRGVIDNPLLETDAKKRNLRAFSRTLWQHMWMPGSSDSFGPDFMG